MRLDFVSNACTSTRRSRRCVQVVVMGVRVQVAYRPICWYRGLRPRWIGIAVWPERGCGPWAIWAK